MGKSSIATLVSVQLGNEIAETLARRAKARGLSRSRYAAMVFERWRDDKYPALDTVDSTARAIVMQELADERSKLKNPQANKETSGDLQRNAHAAAIEEGKGEVISFGRSLEGKSTRKRKASG